MTHKKTGSLDSAVYSALSYGSREDYNDFRREDSLVGIGIENTENDELGVPLPPLSPANSLRKRASSHAVFTNDSVAPLLAGGSISGSERKPRRIRLTSTG